MASRLSTSTRKKACTLVPSSIFYFAYPTRHEKIITRSTRYYYTGPFQSRGEHIFTVLSRREKKNIPAIFYLPVPSRREKTVRFTKPSRPVVIFCPVETSRPFSLISCTLAVPSRAAPPTVYVLIVPSLPVPFSYFVSRQPSQNCPVPSRDGSQPLLGQALSIHTCFTPTQRPNPPFIYIVSLYALPG